MLSLLTNYNHSFEEQIFKLAPNEKKLFCLILIERQKHLIYLFDNFYKEQKSSLFEEMLNIGYEIIQYNNRDVSHIDRIINRIETEVPDTGDYGETEGSFAQNALISLIYFFSWCKDNNNQNFVESINKTLESIDLVNREKNENYDEDKTITQELLVLSSLLQIIKKEEPIIEKVHKVRNWGKRHFITIK